MGSFFLGLLPEGATGILANVSHYITTGDQSMMRVNKYTYPVVCVLLNGIKWELRKEYEEPVYTYLGTLPSAWSEAAERPWFIQIMSTLCYLRPEFG